MVADLAWKIAIAAWIGWAAIWWFAAKSADSAQERDGPKVTILYRLPFAAGGLLMLASPFVTMGGLPDKLLPVGLGLLFAGLAFSVWARWHLGRNWSGRVAVLSKQRLVQTGPYGIVRHPIYAGGLLALAGTAIVVGGWMAFVAAPIAAIGLVVKVLREDHYLTRHFGSDFAAYQLRVPAVVPFLQPRLAADRGARALASTGSGNSGSPQTRPAPGDG